ncbi:TetR/AcrR family transcriptional regulator [Agromyces sp. GXS1127]|uniref:TetR/AcrR family transcriptional regulator n=1 Tax=Agromyces sp. GXS1127 TaxID=3424181 RepID=UPI003D32443C
MGTTRHRLPPDERRNQIVAAAGTVFATRAYDDVSTGEIADACGVSRGLLGHYFPTKRALYLAVVERLLGAPRLLAPAFVEGATVEDRIRQGTTAWVDKIARGRETWLAASGFLNSSLDPDLARIVDAYIDSMSDQICETAGLHEVRDDPAVRAALRGYSAYATTITRRWLTAGDISREQLETLLSSTQISLARRTIPEVLGTD